MSGAVAQDSVALDHALSLVKSDPQALFSDFQWFLFRAQNTVYFTAFSTIAYTPETLSPVVANIVALAPQLTHGFVGARPGQPLVKKLLDAVISVEEVDSLDGYPDKWVTAGTELYDEPELPLFRVRAVVLKNGPDEQGRASMLMVQASHALMEGSDSAQLTRSQHSGHKVAPGRKASQPLLHKLLYGSIASVFAPALVIAGNLFAPRGQAEPMTFRSLAIPRQKLRRVAKHLGVSQRSLIFALTLYALIGPNGGKRRMARALYTLLENERHDDDDDFFRLRSINAAFKYDQDFATFARNVDAGIDKLEGRGFNRTQAIINALLRATRRLAQVMPFLYPDWIFRFNGFYDSVLTLVPPHRLAGRLADGLLEPVYCGSYHNGSNLCCFVPGRDFVTFNCSILAKNRAKIDAIEIVIDRLDAEARAAQR